MPAAPAPSWGILVVDDEKDVHEVTSLAFRRKTWRKRSFELVSCYSAQEARELLSKGNPQRFQVALVDVVMETQTAGLELCRYIRSELPNSLRLVLRTGQPGVAPEERIINDYDIDSYLAKTEVTPEKLFATVRSCLRSSQDIDTLLAFGRQLRRFTAALQTITTDADLVVFMTEGLKFLELKHQARIAFIKSIDDVAMAHDPAMLAVATGHAKKLPLGILHPGAALGADGYVLLFEVQVEGSEEKICGGFVVEQAQAGGALMQSLQGDLTLFTQNWTIAHGALLLQQRVSREKLLNERMYIERIESIATMVTGVAHEINTPLGVANTANGMVVSLANEIRETPPGPELDAIVADLKEASALLTKNLDRASRLVRSFKQLSASQLSDERITTDVASVVRDCLEAMSVETKKRNIPFHLDVREDAQFRWVGFPGHLSQVIMNLIQNVLRYAYKPDAPGRVDIRITDVGENYRVEFEDYGAGVSREILPRIFDPFVTSGREIGGTGLGLAISQNIMTNLLKGQISCTSEVGKGTKFVLVIPHVVPA